MKKWCLVWVWLFSSMVVAGKTWQPLETTAPPKNVVQALQKSTGTSYQFINVLKDNTQQITVTAREGGSVHVARVRMSDVVIPNPRPANSGVYEPLWNNIHAMTFSPDSNLLFVGSVGGGLRVLSLKTMQEIALLRDTDVSAQKAHAGSIEFLWTVPKSSKPNDYWLVSASRDTTIKIWNTENKNLIAKVVIQTNVHRFWRFDTDTIMAATDSQILVIRPNHSQKFLWLNAHANPVIASDFVDGQFWSKASDETYISWNLEKGSLQALHTKIKAATITPNGKVLALMFGTNQIQIRKNGKLWHVIKRPKPQYNDPDILEKRLLLSSDGRYLTLVNLVQSRLTIESFENTKVVSIWDLLASTPQKVPIPENYYWFSGQAYANSVRFLGQKLVVDGEIWDFQNNKWKPKNNSPRYTSIIQTVRGKQLFIGVNDYKNKLQIGLYNAQNQTMIKKWGVLDSNWDFGYETLVTYSPNGSRAAALYKNRLKLWNANNGKVLATIKNQDFANIRLIRSEPSKATFLFSADSQRLLLWHGGTGTIWDSQNLRKTNSFVCQREIVAFLARAVVCNDGARLVWLPIG